MKIKVVIYAALLMFIGFGVFIIGRSISAPPGHANTEIRTQYLAVTQSLQVGTFIDNEDLEWRDLPKDMNMDLVANYIPKGKRNIESLVGAVIRTPLTENSFISNGDFFTPGEPAFIAAVLKSGYRAVAIPVTDVTGGAGLILPGNQVDIIFSSRMQQDSSGLPSAKTILQNVRVIAVNRDIGAPVAPDSKTKENSSANNQSTNKKGTVTLEVSPKEVELLTVAKDVGTLSLSLRSLTDTPEYERVDGTMTSASELVPSEKITSVSPIVTLYGTAQSQ